MAEADTPDEQPVVYAVRISSQANQDAAFAAAYLSEATSDKNLGRAWYASLQQAISALSIFPTAHARSERESRHFGFSIRRMIFRHSPNGAAYHVFYRVREGDDGPTVIILHVRHASRRSLIRAEAREIADNQ